MVRDYYSRKARLEGYYARSAYKLKEINKKYKLIGKHSSVLDLGCAPGGWMQVIKEISKGYVLGIDLKPIKKITGVDFIQGDVNDESMLKKIEKQFDVIVSDLAPKTTGIVELDHELSIDLAKQALKITKTKLKKNGHFLAKVFQGIFLNDIIKEIKKNFTFVKTIRPKATKKGSKEVYIVAKQKI